VEACPEDAIQMTGITLPQYFREQQKDGEILGRSRSDFIFDRDKLVANNDIPQPGLSVNS
jgi:formate hydrogenlyase subunit 6/NADH:ubiquinone oxidoreductase subunit I